MRRLLEWFLGTQGGSPPSDDPLAWLPAAVKSLAAKRPVSVEGLGRFEVRETWKHHRSTLGITFTPAPGFAELPGIPARVRAERRLPLPELGELEWVAPPAGISGPLASPFVRFSCDPGLLAKLSPAALPKLSPRALEAFPSLRSVTDGLLAGALDRIVLQPPNQDDLDLVCGEAAHDATLARLVLPVLVARVPADAPELATVLYLAALVDVDGPWVDALDEAASRALTGQGPALVQGPAVAWRCKRQGEPDAADVVLAMLSGDPPSCPSCAAEFTPRPGPPTELSEQARACGLTAIADVLAWTPTGRCEACV